MSTAAVSAVLKRTSTIGLALAVMALVVVPGTALGAVSVTRAELQSGQLRVEGRGAQPNAVITITSDSVATGRADGAGTFRVESSDYTSTTCRATASDGATSSETALADCVTSATAPNPAPTPTPAPTSTSTSTSTSTLIIVDDALPNGNVGAAYGGSLFSRGAVGDKPVEYRIVSGRLPAGLSMTRSFGVASTLITGTPTTIGTSTFTVEARDESGQTARKTFTITIEPPLPLLITNQSDQLAPAAVGASYSIQLFANGGVRPYSWSIVAGELPPGLALSGSGLVSGTPVTAGTYAFTARVTDGARATVSRQFSIAVSG